MHQQSSCGHSSQEALCFFLGSFTDTYVEKKDHHAVVGSIFFFTNVRKLQVELLSARQKDGSVAAHFFFCGRAAFWQWLS